MKKKLFISGDLCLSPFPCFGLRKDTGPLQWGEKAGLIWQSHSEGFQRTEESGGILCCEVLWPQQTQNSLAELLLPCLNQILLTADLVPLVSSDSPQWESVITSTGNLIKAAVASSTWETNEDGNFSLEILWVFFMCQRKVRLLCLLNTLALGLFVTIRHPDASKRAPYRSQTMCPQRLKFWDVI